MSNIQVKVPVQVFIAKPVLATLNAAKTEKVLSDMLAHIGDQETAKPSYIHCTKDTARAGMGGKFTAFSFINGLTYLTAAFAYGQGKLPSLCSGLPDFAVAALEGACKQLKNGAGCSVASLKTAVLAGMVAVCALPVRSREKKAVTEKPAVEGTCTTVAPDMLATVIELRKGFTPAQGPHTANATCGSFDMGNGQALATMYELETAKAASEKAASEKAASEKAASAPVLEPLPMPEQFAKWATNQPEQAFAALQAMALTAGYRLVKLTVKKAA